MGAVTATYQRRTPENTVLYRVVQDSLGDFMAQMAENGRTVPEFVQREFAEFLSCGRVERGFVRVFCDTCKDESIVALSCKCRGWCPSCAGRRMAERAAFLVDHVLPRTSYRHWILSLPFQIRYILAYNAELSAKALGIFVREIHRWYRFSAKAEIELESVSEAQCGSVAFIQRFDSGLRLNLHYHVLALDGVYVPEQLDSNGRPVFFGMPAPTDHDVLDVALRSRKKILKLLNLNDDGFDMDYGCHEDPLAEDEPLLAEASKGAIMNRTATGPRAGQPTQRLYDELLRGGRGGVFTSTRCVNVDGFSLHANVRVSAAERGRLEKLVRYTAWGPISNERLRELPDGRLAYDLKRVWADGTRALVFSPGELLERLMPLVPLPRKHQVLYYGVLAPNAILREAVVASACGGRKKKVEGQSKNYTWAQLMERAFGHQLLICPVCGGPRRVLEVVTDRETIRAILRKHGLSSELPEPAPAKPNPQLELPF